MKKTVKSPEYGQNLTVTDIKERLIQSALATKLLLWPPNLFAFTSYILHHSGAYQLVVSPPPGKSHLYHWPPTASLLGRILKHLPRIGKRTPERRNDLATFAANFKTDLDFATHHLEAINNAARQRALNGQGSEQPPDVYTTWSFLVRKTALEWRWMFDHMSGPRWETYLKHMQVDNDTEPVQSQLALEREVAKFPPFLRVCWEVFADLYDLDRETAETLPVNSLLCNSGGGGGSDKQRESAWLGAVCLLTMHAIADDASVGWGIVEQTIPVDFPTLRAIRSLQRANSRETEAWTAAYDRFRRDTSVAHVIKSSAQKTAAELLAASGTMATIAQERARILPKRHNPDVGITLRSLSSNLAFHLSPIKVAWRRDHSSHLAAKLSSKPHGRHLARPPVTFTMLLLPMPMQVHTREFQRVEGDLAREALDNRGGYGFFRYIPTAKSEPVIEEIRSAIEYARAEETSVDMLVLPECALSLGEAEELKAYLTSDEPQRGDPVSVYITGVSAQPLERASRFDCDNMVKYGYRDGATFQTGEQHKHHRWQLNKSQIVQYGLSQQLPVDTKWWEAINVERRQVSFINVGDGITLCPLICEDLARQDPIADLIRQVGPSLVVTILMDGPQHRDRWSSRYAAILSEDPGSAVLALTSFGMVRRWNTRFGRLSRVVALWNDKEGSREIELEAGACGILLTLKVEAACEVIADGRLEMCATSTIVLTDVNQIYPRAAVAKDTTQSSGYGLASRSSAVQAH